MSLLFGLPNRVMTEIGSIILQDPYILNYLYYTSQEDSDIDLFEKEVPPTTEIVDKHLFIGRRIPINLIEAGAYMDIRVVSYRPSYENTGKYIKLVQVSLDVICHRDCQKTLRGTRDITLIALIQSALEKSDLTGIGSYKIVSMSEILGLEVDYTGYSLKIEITGFNKDLYE